MQSLRIFWVREIFWVLWLSSSLLLPAFSFGDADEIEQELTDRCESLASSMAQTNKKFPESIKNIEGLVTWRAALCGERPKEKGIVIALCDGHLTYGESIFFWQIKTKAGKLKNGFLTCK